MGWAPVMSGVGLDKAILAADDDFGLDHDGLIRDWFVFGALLVGAMLGLSSVTTTACSMKRHAPGAQARIAQVTHLFDASSV